MHLFKIDLVQPSTGTGTDIFVSLLARNIAAGSGFFFLPFCRYLLFPPNPQPCYSFIIIFFFFLTAIQNSAVYKNLNAKPNRYSFFYKRVTDPRVFLIAGPALAVTLSLGLGCAVRFRLKRNDAKIKQNLFRFEAKKIRFFTCFASKRKAGNQKRNESERSENIIGKRKGNQKIAKISHKKVKFD
jgi:hypothetical protein